MSLYFSVMFMGLVVALICAGILFFWPLMTLCG